MEYRIIRTENVIDHEERIWWKSFFFKKTFENYKVYKNKRIIAIFSVEINKYYIELHIKIYSIIYFKKSIKLITDYLFFANEDIQKITVHVLSKELLGILILKFMGFKKEIEVKDCYLVNNNLLNYLSYSKFKNILS